jgi:hypothetical protein
VNKRGIGLQRLSNNERNKPISINLKASSLLTYIMKGMKEVEVKSSTGDCRGV